MSVSASIALLQLASPALPIGGYSYSTALEWGVDGGAVRDEAGAREWIADALGLSLASFEGPLAREAMRAAARWPAPDAADALESLNAAAIAARETAELRLESEQMGYSLGRWLEAVCPEPDADAWIAARLSRLGDRGHAPGPRRARRAARPLLGVRREPGDGADEGGPDGPDRRAAAAALARPGARGRGRASARAAARSLVERRARPRDRIGAARDAVLQTVQVLDEESR
jgi:hypothetical protein